ncbi:DUF2141 domain-containing protein [Bdellovibrio sp. HCB117]|uniref:DUF2141 domain-containing protein n=1 Tax=Bdellovibrio sp. HCB117 TaxID=3394359 RepID=UPI0039B3ED17
MSKLKFLCAYVIILLSLPAWSLTLNFSNLRNGNGYLAVSIFSEKQKESFPGKAEQATKTFYLKLEGKKELSIDVDDLDDDTYAVAVMHDEDEDKKFKTNFVGLPQEGFGFSMNPRVYFGVPSFKRAAFKSSETKTLDIKLKYF